jgi:hypothetical protein
MPALALALLLLSAPAGAATIVIDFESVAPGSYDTLTVSGVTFEGVTGVRVADFGVQSDGLGILPDDDDSGHAIELHFATPVSSLALDFGNDDPEVLTTAHEAVLEAFLGAVKVGEARVAVNANDVMDQVITLSGVGPFDRALFAYPGGIDEVIDNVTFETVPEPGTFGLAAVALTVVLAGTRSRTR